MNRRGVLLTGLVLVLLGIGAVLIDGVGFVTEEEVVDAGPIEVSAEQERQVGVPTWIGAGLAGGGVVLLLVGGAMRRRD